MKKQKSAFTLLEIMISIVLFILVVSLCVKSSTFLNRSILKSEIDKLYSACMYLQRLAMVTNQNQILHIDTNKNRYLYNGKIEQLASPIIFGTVTGVKGPPSTPTNNVTKPVTFKSQHISFKPNGILQPGTIYLCDKNKQYQYALTVPVSQISFLRKYCYDGSWKYLM